VTDQQRGDDEGAWSIRQLESEGVACTDVLVCPDVPTGKPPRRERHERQRPMAYEVRPKTDIP
jgi:hypothetical protein